MSDIDWELVKEILQKVHWALTTIERRFRAVPSAEFFRTEEGRERMDGICMLFEAVGESFKSLDKITRKTLLSRYPEIDWKKIIGFRDVVAHQYFDINELQLFDNCQNHLPPLFSTVERMLGDLQTEREPC